MRNGLSARTGFRGLVAVLGAMTACLTPLHANAALVTFGFSGLADCGLIPFGCDPTLVEAETGLFGSGLHPFTGLMTIDTTVPFLGSSSLSHTYRFDTQPGVGLSVTVGTLTLFADAFDVAVIRDDFRCSSGSQDRIVIDSGHNLLPLSTRCGAHGSRNVLSSYDLTGLANSPLDMFSLDGDTFIGTGRAVGQWAMDVHELEIHRVPEPALLTLFGLCLAGLALLGARLSCARGMFCPGSLLNVQKSRIGETERMQQRMQGDLSAR